MQQLNFQSNVTELPPQNVEAEEAILGGIMLDPEAISRVERSLVMEAFYLSPHRDIYQGFLRLNQSGKGTDLLSVTSWLIDNDLLNRVGGKNKLATLVSRTVSAINIDALAELVMEKYTRRRLIKAASQINELGYQTETELPIILDEAESQLFAVTQDRAESGLIHISQVLVSNFEDIEAKSEGTVLAGIPSGYYDLDALTGGFSPGDLIIIAARPSVGKTAFAVGISQNIAASYRLPVAIFSLEMSSEQLSQRLLSSEAQIESTYLRSGRIRESQWEPLSRAMGVLSDLPIYLEDTPSITANHIRSQSRQLQAKCGRGLGLIVIDYLQLMQGASDNRVQELSKITRQLKALARELSVPVIALSQLNRGVEARTNKRPMLSDLRESGCLSGDTLISLPSGEWPIKELVGKSSFAVWGLNQWTMKLECGTVTNVFSTGIREVFNLTTRFGRRIRATANHRFLTSGGWRRLDQLGKEDFIRLPIDINNLAETTISYGQIFSIEPAGEEEVFDLTVPGFNNFIANNLVVHNSIEQDADLVIMLYRDEIYFPETPDRGIAEVIVSKHRNGATGTAKLLFNPVYTKFQNLRI